jgi:Fe-S cluster biogenesis protein NfuA/nitrite reductase/ring-hydroxylating ferredoxin subunit
VDDRAARERVARVERLLEDLESVADPGAREKALEVVEALLELYGEGLRRVVATVSERDDGELAEALGADELVAHLLLLHGLHPVPLADRVRGALAGVRPYLESHGGNVELLGVDEGVARLRLEGSCSGCPSSTATLKLAIEKAIREAAPDVEEIVAEDAGGAAPAPQLIQIEVGSAPEPATTGEGEGGWAIAGAMPELAGPGPGPVVKRVGGEPLLFCKLEGRFYAYRPECPGCGSSLADAAIGDGAIRCPGCGSRYDVRRAGRGRDGGEAHLEPVPLLVDDAGLVKVALGAAA